MTDDDIIALTAGPANLLEKERRAALVEKVAKEMFRLTHLEPWDEAPTKPKVDMMMYATAAIALIRAEVLEEAARELDRWGDIYGDNAAAAIRALKEKP